MIGRDGAPTESRRVAFDVAPVKEAPTGVGVYAASLATALSERLGERLVVIGRRDEAKLDGRLTDAAGWYSFRGRNYHEWLQRHAESDARRGSAGLVHYTNASAPLYSRVPFVVTVHDLSLLRYPRLHPRLRLATLPLMLAAIARARLVLVPSSATRRELQRVLRVSGRRIVVVRHALPEGRAGLSGTQVGAVLARYRLAAGQYLLAVGTVEPRKNHRRVLAAFERLAADRPDLKLVFAGPIGWHADSILHAVEQSPLRERVVLTGYLPAAELDALIGASTAVCYVSLYEGYGFPIIEAMALGAPVVTSNVSAMPETAGGAAVLVDPSDVGSIVRGIELALGRRDELAGAGRAWAARRSWHDVAGETAEAYDWALSQRR